MQHLNTHPKYPKRYSVTGITDTCYYENAPYYEAESVIKNQGIWADSPDISEKELKKRKIWLNNKLISLQDAGIKFFKNGKPMTPIKTGILGRGLLGQFGPNHAADPIITRFNFWKFRIEFIGVLRNDTNEWAIPGGMVDPGEKVTATLKREFTEEAASKCNTNIIDKIFENETVLYAGPTYGDPRTTDSAWIETYVAHYHINYNLWSKLKLSNQESENQSVKWISCNSKKLYGDHAKFIKLAKENAINKIMIPITCITTILSTLSIISIINIIINNNKNSVIIY